MECHCHVDDPAGGHEDPEQQAEEHEPAGLAGGLLSLGQVPSAQGGASLMGVHEGDDASEQAAEEGHQDGLCHVVLGRGPVLHRGRGWHASPRAAVHREGREQRRRGPGVQGRGRGVQGLRRGRGLEEQRPLPPWSAGGPRAPRRAGPAVAAARVSWCRPRGWLIIDGRRGPAGQGRAEG